MNRSNKGLYALPGELFNYIIWLSCGPINLDIYNKKRDINKELAHYKSMRDKFDEDGVWDICDCETYGKDGVYLTSDKIKITHSKNLSFAYRVSTRSKKKMMLYFKCLLV